jgi:hypothetical protein
MLKDRFLFPCLVWCNDVRAIFQSVLQTSEIPAVAKVMADIKTLSGLYTVLPNLSHENFRIKTAKREFISAVKSW